MPRSLVYLIKASGFAATAGQSMRLHAAGNPLPAGAKMTDYDVTGLQWTANGQPAPEFTTVLNGESFTYELRVVRNSRAHLIQQTTGNALQFTYLAPDAMAWAEVGPITWLDGPDGQPNGLARCTVTYRAQPGAGTAPLQIIAVYAPDAGPYNVTRQLAGPLLNVQRPTGTPPGGGDPFTVTHTPSANTVTFAATPAWFGLSAPIEQQWSWNDPSFSTPVPGSSITVDSFSTTTGTIYGRARPNGSTGPWEVRSSYWSDPRPDD